MSSKESTEETNSLNTSDVNLPEQNIHLKRHYPGIYLIIFYIPLVIVPWATTIVLAYRPISKSTYYYQGGFNLDEYKRMQSWVTAISVLNSIASLLAVPVVSFVIAQTAVIFSQKRAASRQLSVRDIFALADRAWTDISVLFKLMRAKGHGSRAFKCFICLASGLLLITALQPPLYQILVNWESINIPSGVLERIRVASNVHELRDDKIFIGYDAEPATMEMIPQATVLQSVQAELPSLRKSAPEMNMWIDYNGTQPPAYKLDNRQGDAINSFLNIRSRQTPQDQKILPAFFSAMRFNVTTGTKRYHAMRFNSTVECRVVSKDKFPANCPGSKPYSTSIQVRNDTFTSELRICVPGRWGTSPWTLSRHRQDIREEVYLQLLDNSEKDTYLNIHCASATTRGYFELGNYRTKGAYGPLLEQWPSRDIIEKDFNDRGHACISGDDVSCRGAHSYVPTEWSNERDRVRGWTPREPEYMRWNASGPLVTSIMALFGDNSWICTVSNLTSTQTNSSSESAVVPIWWSSLCENQPLYHSYSRNVKLCDPDKRPSETVAQWFSTYFTGDHAVERLEDLIFMGVVLTHKSILLTHRDRQAPRLLYLANGRGIYSSPGFSILKPNIALASIIAISILLAIQIAGLMFCGFYIARTPTWTRVFNAMAIARIGSGLEKDKLPFDGQYAEDEDYERLMSAEVPLMMASATAFRRRPKYSAKIRKEEMTAVVDGERGGR